MFWDAYRQRTEGAETKIGLMTEGQGLWRKWARVQRNQKEPSDRG